MSRAVRWYNQLAGLYDVVTLGDRVYAEMRRMAVGSLGLRAGETIVDLFCGTGADLPHLAAALERRGRIVAIDGSPEMLARACARAQCLPEGVDLESVLSYDRFWVMA